MNLKYFFKENAVKVENVKYVASERLKDDDGKPLEWEIRCISVAEDEEIKESCVKSGQSLAETNQNLYFGKLAAKCTVFPNLNDVELQNSYGVMGAEVLLKAMLTTGEYGDYLFQVNAINGFNVSFYDKAEELKK